MLNIWNSGYRLYPKWYKFFGVILKSWIVVGGFALSSFLFSIDFVSANSGNSRQVLLTAGDISQCSNNNSAKTARIIKRFPGATLAVLGDSAYPDGSAADYQCYDGTWGEFKDRTRPAVGNHEYNTSGAKGYFDYFGARAGNRKKGYYTYKLGSWRIIALNSNCKEIGGCGPRSRQYRWLKRTLAKSTGRCSLAYMHHPWMSSGPNGPTRQMGPMVRLLYRYRAEIILSGHDHIYERFAPQRPLGRRDIQRGIRQFVVGTGGFKLHPFYKRLKNSQVRNNTHHGILKLVLHTGSYRWQFIAVTDGFTDTGLGLCH